MQLDGKKVIVTGTTYGIGASIAKALVGANATVASVARSTDLGEAQAKELTAMGPGSIRFYEGDVSNRAQVKQAFAAAAADMGSVDALVHVAGVETGHPPEQETDDEWDWMFNINAKGTFITNQEIFPYLKENGGRILNFGSGASITGMVDGAAYSASKGAVASYSRALANAWGKYGIAVNLILPGVWTPMYQAHRDRFTAEELVAHDADMKKRVKIGGRLGDPEKDLTPVILFLLSDGARFLTAHGFSIDGGAVPLR